MKRGVKVSQPMTRARTELWRAVLATTAGSPACTVIPAALAEAAAPAQDARHAQLQTRPGNLVSASPIQRRTIGATVGFSF